MVLGMVGLNGDSIKKLDQSNKGRGADPQRLCSCFCVFSFMNYKFMWRNSKSCGYRLVACIDSVKRHWKLKLLNTMAAVNPKCSLMTKGLQDCLV